MTLHQLMLAYQQNSLDLFIIHGENGKEIQRFSMGRYFTEGLEGTYGNSRVIAFIVDVVDVCCVHFQIYLDDLNPKAK